MYSNKTLIGNWSADRSYKAEEVANSKSFPEIPVDDSDVDKLEKMESKKVASLQKDVPKPGNFVDNFSSSYDLSYKHFPKAYEGNIPRSLECGQEFHQPSSEYLPNFGNITKSGVMDDKMEEWDLDDKKSRQISSSAYEQDFKAPEAADYAFKRYAKHNN
jgi:hypothetical protein